MWMRYSISRSSTLLSSLAKQQYISFAEVMAADTVRQLQYLRCSSGFHSTSNKSEFCTSSTYGPLHILCGGPTCLPQLLDTCVLPNRIHRSVAYIPNNLRGKYSNATIALLSSSFHTKYDTLMCCWGRIFIGYAKFSAGFSFILLRHDRHSKADVKGTLTTFSVMWRSVW